MGRAFCFPPFFCGLIIVFRPFFNFHVQVDVLASPPAYMLRHTAETSVLLACPNIFWWLRRYAKFVTALVFPLARSRSHPAKQSAYTRESEIETEQWKPECFCDEILTPLVLSIAGDFGHYTDGRERTQANYEHCRNFVLHYLKPIGFRGLSIALGMF